MSEYRKVITKPGEVLAYETVFEENPYLRTGVPERMGTAPCPGLPGMRTARARCDIICGDFIKCAQNPGAFCPERKKTPLPRNNS